MSSDIVFRYTPKLGTKAKQDMISPSTFSASGRYVALLGIASLTACGSGTSSFAPQQSAATQSVATQSLPQAAAEAQVLGSDAASYACAYNRPGSITLGPSLAPFAVLAGSTVTNVGFTKVGFAPGAVTKSVPGITGAVDDDLIGVAPGSAVSGFYSPGTDTSGPDAIYGTGGAFNPNRTIPQNAENALTIAYNTAAARPATGAVSGDLSQASVPGYPTGTLPPGVYKSTSTVSIKQGNLTLDGLNNPRSIFIFQVASSLKTSLNGGIGGNMILENQANPCNIYWQIGSSAVLGGSTFDGNVLAYTAITINATTFNGRALARSAAVTIPVAAGSAITNPGGS
jgi:hypothetical protein